MSEFYSIERILSTKSTYNLLLGQRANGKSFQVKLECVKEAFLGLGDFIYLRRWGLEVKNDDVTDYFSDCPVEKITEGKYNYIHVFRSRIYLANVDKESGEVKRGQCIGRTAALTGAEHLKSVIERGRYKNIIYEEFCSDQFIPGEPAKLQQFVATVFGLQHSGRVWLIGNTVSRVNPYFSEYQLNIKKMQPGDLDLYEFTTESGDKVSLAVEFCSTMKIPSGMFFGEVSKNITTGVWETEVQPQIPEDFKPFKVIYQAALRHTEFFFLLKVIKNKVGEKLLFCVPADEESYEKTRRKLSDRVSGDPLETEKLIPLLKGDKIILSLLKKGKLVYANNLTGTDFQSILKARGGLK